MFFSRGIRWGQRLTHLTFILNFAICIVCDNIDRSTKHWFVSSVNRVSALSAYSSYSFACLGIKKIYMYSHQFLILPSKFAKLHLIPEFWSGSSTFHLKLSSDCILQHVLKFQCEFYILCLECQQQNLPSSLFLFVWYLTCKWWGWYLNLSTWFMKNILFE